MYAYFNSIKSSINFDMIEDWIIGIKFLPVFLLCLLFDYILIMQVPFG